MQKFKDKKITIFGMAKSGISAARRLNALGARVLITEKRPASSIDQNLILELQKLGIELELGGHSERALGSTDLIVVSPGVHLDIPILCKASQEEMPIISEIELAYQILKKPIIAITGTNGKTTTTTLTFEMLKAGGIRGVVAGNIGNPLSAVLDGGLDYIVAEISSYQLEAIQAFKPKISVILNIQPDHLARHKSMAEYIKQKSRIFANQTSDDYLVYNLDDALVCKMVQTAAAKQVGVTKSDPNILALKPSEIKIPGRHNLENALAAAQVAYLCGVSREKVAAVLRAFPGVEHRIEYLTKIDGVEFYNDSKSTNPDSTLVALETFAHRNVVLILGGRDKGSDLSSLCKKIKEGVKSVVLLGEAASRFSKALEQSGYTKIKQVNSIKEAVKSASNLASSGDIILLSPACSSFDMFANFEERGRAFKECVNQK
ncbi:MAG: UDP-N-acetylmuramoyl-L-alanine--D-glutamate ligase [Candidatus Saganbacteria bacterium]|nr:UDP-N-acetylmuramoyl-L-alanine--D-glutamate ligase [Candidatus Saganbacteria bacterium]